MVELPQQQMQMMGASFAMPSLQGNNMMLPSLAMGAQVLPSMDPTMDDDVAARYGQMLVQQNAAQLQEMMVLSGDYTATMKSNLQELTSIGSNIGQINQILSGALQGLQQTFLSGSGGSGGGGGGAGGGEGGGGTRMAPTGLPEGGSGSQPDTRDTRTLAQRFTEGRQVGSSPSSMRQRVSQVTRTMAGRAAEGFQSAYGHWDLNPDADGNIHYYDPNPQIGEDGNAIPSRSSPATPENLEAASRESARATRLTGVLSNYAEGSSVLGGLADSGGTIGALGSGALKLAGPIGLAVGAASFGFKQFADQTEAGTQYRAAYGTDAGRFAFTQRAGADLQGIGGFFNGVGYGRAKENYEAGAQQGLTGDRLGESTDFMNDMYTKLGLDTQTSVQAVAIAAQNTTISLSSLRDNIMDVSQAAVDAGKNSEVAVQSFLAVTQQVQQNATNTAAAPALAGSISTSMSKNLASSLNTPQMASNLAGMLTQTNVAMLAQQQGVSFGTVSQELATGTGNVAAQTIGIGLQRAVEQICTAGGSSVAGVKAITQQMFPNAKHLSSDMQQQVMNALPGFANVSPQMMAQIFGVFGMQINPGDVVNFFFNALLTDLANLGTTDPGNKQASAAQVKGGASQILGSGGLSSAGFSALGTPTTPVGGSAGKGGSAANAMAASVQAMTSFGSDQEYADYAKSSGNRDLAVEALIKNSSTLTKFAGKDNLDDVTFTMKDGSGKSLSQILKSPALLAQFDSGTPYVKGSGSNANDVESVSQITKYGGAGAAAGASKSVQMGNATITLSGEASRLFNLSGPSAAQQQGVPPSGSQDPTRYTQ